MSERITPADQSAPPVVATPDAHDIDAADSAPGGRPTSRLRAALGRLWDERLLGFTGAIVLALAWGLLAAWLTPRGPLTTGEALSSMVISLAIGAAAGFLTRSRSMMLIAPVAFAVAFEVGRLDLSGPMVDGVQVSFYGLIALITGRGFHALLSLLWIALGAYVGYAIAQAIAAGPGAQGTRSRVGTYGPWAAIALIAIAFAGLFAVVAQPASTDPIVNEDGNVVPGSVAELTTIDVNGHDLALMIRGHDVDNPVLLFLAGGPGGSEMGSMRNHLSGLEEHLTVVTWDQRGAGTSYPELDPTDTITPEGYLDDTIVVTDYLRERFDEDRIYLLGQSWGTTLGIWAIQEAPERYHAYIGTGQMVSQRETDRIFYRDTLAWARENGDDALAEELEAIGPPPYERMLDYETSNSHEMSVYPYDHSVNSEGEAQMSENIIADEYTLIDEVHLLGAFVDTFAALYPQLQDIDFRETATEFEVPVFFAQGAHEADGRAELFAEWYSMIDAPIKELVTLETSGHRPLFEQPDEFVEFMVDTVLARTAPSAAA
ncbi:MAG: alpha/beta hydrolase [Candidatus Limnocylindrales bacterium]